MTGWVPCENVLAEDGYPSEAELETVRTWPIENAADLTAAFAYVAARWTYPDYWVKIARRRRSSAGGHLRRRYEVHTVGWSGNESLVSAMEDNTMLWVLTWRAVRRGGHYEFEIDEEMR